jgi:hypothetical protein
LDASKRHLPIMGSRLGSSSGNGSQQSTIALKSTSASFLPAWLHSMLD